MSSNAMWYKNGNFYEVPTTHIDFFLQNPELLGFTQEDKEQLCIENGIPADSTTWLDTSQERTDILLEVLKRGAIRIRFYGGKTSVQCYDHNNKMNYRELQNCIIDGYGKCFGNILTVLDTKGWGEMLNDMGWGRQIKDFISSSVHKQNYRYFNIYKEKPVMSGYEKNNNSLNKIFNNDNRQSYKQFVFSCCDRFNIDLYGWEQPIISIDKVLKSSSQYNIDNIIHGKQAFWGYVILSAEMENLSVAENNKRTKELEDCIVQEGYSFKNALGGYTYEGADGYTKEKSFVVFNYMRNGEPGDFDELEDFALRMCKKFDQQSVLIARRDEVPVYKDRNGNLVSNPGRSSRNVSVNMKNPPAYTSFKTAKGYSEKDKNGKVTRKEYNLPDRYTTMDIAFNSFVRTLKKYGITHLGIVNSTANGNIRSAARGMVIVC